MQQLALDLLRPAVPSLDNFAPGRNTEAVAVLHAWLSDGVLERCIYLWGPPGCGKSHLLRAAVEFAHAQQRTALYLDRHSLADLEGASELPALTAVDDVQELDSALQGHLFRLLHRAREESVRLVAAGSAAPAGLPLREDVRTRLAAGLVFQLHLLSDAEKAEALESHALSRGFKLAPELAEYLLHHGRRDLPSLMNVLDAVDRHSLQTKRPITLPLLRDVLRLEAEAAQPRPK